MDAKVAGQTDAPKAGTRPPTVVLTDQNTQHLKTFPRPPRDNGIGLHFHLDLSDQFIAETIEHLKEIRATWTCIYARDELQTERAARACFAAGIMPVVRIGMRINEGCEPALFVQGLRKAWQSAGWGGPAEPLYVQLFNEPEDPREWNEGFTPPDAPQRFGATWAAEAPKIVDVGGIVGIQVLDRPAFDQAVDAIARNHREDIWKRAVFVHHNYGQNHPPAYPFDEIKQRTDPGTTILQDYTAALKFLAHAAWMQERLGFVMPVIGGEGGWWLYNDEDKHYPKVEWPLHAEYHKEMYEWFRTGVLSNGEPTPDYLFSITSWIVGSWTFAAQNWWGNILSPNGRLDMSIGAMKSIPEFIRRFSWDGPSPQPGGSTTPVGLPDDKTGTDATKPEKPEPEAGKPDKPEPGNQPEAPVGTEAKPEPAALEWDERLDSVGVRLERVEGAAWRLVKAEYRDGALADRRHHIYVKALRPGGQPAEGIRFFADYVGRQSDQSPAFGTTDANGDTNLPIFIGFDPNLKNGIIFASVEGARADVVHGMGLPWDGPVQFVLTWQEV